MYNLFSSPPRALGGQIIIPRFKDVSARISEDVERVVNYYRTGTHFVRSDHILVKLISTMNVPLSYDLGQYYDVASARAMGVATSLGLTSSINAGRWTRGRFYYNCDELTLAYLNDDSPYRLNIDWKNLQPVKPLECPVSNLWYMLPNGKPHNIEEGLAVIGIDIPMLMVQYRGFFLEQNARRLAGEGSMLGIPDFVGKYVIPNMLYRQTDLAIHNRTFNLVTGAPMGDSTKRHPFRVSNYTELLDKGLAELIERVGVTKMRYRDILENIPKVFSEYPLEMPDVAETRQCWWALFLTRLKAISFLFDAAGEQGRHYNQSELNALKIDLKRFQSENIFKTVLTDRLLDDTQYELRRLLSKL